MKRFFCTTCKKVRRVRRLPIVVSSNNVVDRTGVCDWHISGRIHPIRTRPVFSKKVESSVSVKTSKGRK